LKLNRLLDFEEGKRITLEKRSEEEVGDAEGRLSRVLF